MEIFWRTIAYYNSATWLLQIVIILIGIALTGFAYRPTTSVGENGDEVLYDRPVYVDFSGLLLYLL